MAGDTVAAGALLSGCCPSLLRGSPGLGGGQQARGAVGSEPEGCSLSSRDGFPVPAGQGRDQEGTKAWCVAEARLLLRCQHFIELIRWAGAGQRRAGQAKGVGRGVCTGVRRWFVGCKCGPRPTAAVLSAAVALHSQPGGTANGCAVQ